MADMKMTKTDYEKILSYYKIPIANLSSTELKRKAEEILAKIINEYDNYTIIPYYTYD